MMKLGHCAVVLGIVLMACSSGSSAQPTGPQHQAEVTVASGLQVKASIVSATLGEECGASSGLTDCASPAPIEGDAGADGGSSKTSGGCGGTCHASSVQIAFNAGAGSQGVRIEIVTVQLVNATGSVVDTLTASRPQAWNGSAYAAWDQTVKPSSELKASYQLTAPAWSKLGAGSSAVGSPYATTYKLHVTLRIDGVEVILESETLNREPAVVT